MSVALSFLDRPTFALNESELMSRFDEIIAVERRIAAARLEVVHDLCTRGIPAARGYAHPVGMLRDHLKLTSPAASQMYRLAKALPDRPEVNDALVKGDISEAQAAVITRTITDIAPYTTKEEQDQAADMLVSQAAVLPPKELTVCGNRILHHIAPEAADKRDHKRVKDFEKAAWDSRSFSITDDGHGRFRFRGTTTAEGAALLHTILDPLTHPKRANKTESATSAAPTDSAADASTTDASTTGTSATDASAPGPSMPEGSQELHTGCGTHDSGGDDSPQDKLPSAFKDHRTAQQRRHDALVDACRLLLASDRLPENGGSKPQVAVTAAFDAVSRQLVGGVLDTGTSLSAEEARRMSCDAGILPAILDGHGVPLDLGRERRLITGSLRKALVLRDHGCAFPGCDRPSRWCQAHHCVHWSDGGKTCLDNAVLLCGFHHGRVHHEDGWTVHIGDGGHAWFTAPTWLDPQQTPRRNLYHASL